MLQLNFNPFPVLETERLLLKRISLDDAENMFVLRTNKDLMRYIDKPMPSALWEVEELVRKMEAGIYHNDAIAWGIFQKGEEGLIGVISYHRIEEEHYRAEVGYMLHPGKWNKGFLSEALREVLKYGFDCMGLHSIEAIINPDNSASARLLIKLGLLEKRTIRRTTFLTAGSSIRKYIPC